MAISITNYSFYDSQVKNTSDHYSHINQSKDKYQNKVQEINDQLRDLNQAKNVIFIGHDKNIKSQHSNKSKLHLTRGEVPHIIDHLFSGNI